MKLTKTLDVSELTDAQVSKLEKIVNLHPTVIERLMGPEADRLEAVVKQRDELAWIIKRILHVFEQPEDFSRPMLTRHDYAGGIRQVVTRSGVNLDDYNTIKS